jgi:hypothetical protein
VSSVGRIQPPDIEFTSLSHGLEWLPGAEVFSQSRKTLVVQLLARVTVRRLVIMNRKQFDDTKIYHEKSQHLIILPQVLIYQAHCCQRVYSYCQYEHFPPLLRHYLRFFHDSFLVLYLFDRELKGSPQLRSHPNLHCIYNFFPPTTQPYAIPQPV